MARHPIQPIEKNDHGTHRFKKNKIVEYLLEFGRHDLNTLATMDFSDNDHSQFAQLIGYSFSGWSGLSYVSDEEYDEAYELNQQLLKYVPDYSI